MIKPPMGIMGAPSKIHNRSNWKKKEEKQQIEPVRSFPTKNMARLPEQEIFARAAALAQREAAAATGEEYQRIGNEQTILEDQYISYVSPDRDAVYRDAVTKIHTMDKEKGSDFDYIKTIFDYLGDKDCMKTNQEADLNHIPLNGNAYMAFGGSFQAGPLVTIYDAGEEIMSIDSDGIMTARTKAEQARAVTFREFYLDVLKTAKQELKTEQFLNTGKKEEGLNILV